jgi:ferredoxin-type protein NapH
MSRVKKLQIVTQLTALALFITLLVTGRIQVWMGIFLASVVLTLFFGRIYCGWICPNNTVMKLVTGIKARFKLKSFAVPELLKKPAFRYGMLAAFLLAFILTMVSGKSCRSSLYSLPPGSC